MYKHRGVFNRGAIEAALKKLEFPLLVMKWVDHIKGGQTVTDTKGETSFEGKVISGCSPGGILSPLLWNLVIDKLLEIEKQGCKIVGYADDPMIIVRGTFLDTLMEITRRTLKIVKTWCAKTSLSLNPKKSSRDAIKESKTIV